MRNLHNDFSNKNIEFEKLLEYGFLKNKSDYVFETKICDARFKVIVTISKEEQTSKVIDLLSDEEYMLVDVHHANGDFVGKIKEEYENILNDIVVSCTTKDVFKSKQAKEVIRYIQEKYDDHLEYLWERFPEDAVWRNKKK